MLLLRRILVAEEGRLVLPTPKAALLNYYAHGIGHLLERTR